MTIRMYPIGGQKGQQAHSPGLVAHCPYGVLSGNCG